MVPQFCRAYLLKIIEYHDATRREVRFFDLTEDRFTLLTVGNAPVQEPLQCKIRYINRYNAMKAELRH